MLFIMFLFMLFLTILSLVTCIIPLINSHTKKNREKMSPFECGFDPFSKSRLPFSIHFFSISLMFLIFDIEITLVLPSPMLFEEINMTTWMVSSTFLFLILTLGLIMEWKEGSMNWKYGL